MRQVRLPELVEQLRVERVQAYRGTAKIAIKHLNFAPIQHDKRTRRRVDGLKARFASTGCLRKEAKNHVQAVIPQQLWDICTATLTEDEKKQMTTTDPQDVVELSLPAGSLLECKQGRIRLHAATEFLPPREQWWIVDLYLDGPYQLLHDALSEGYSDEWKPDRGEVYVKIRQFQRESNAYLQRRWQNCLSDHERSNLKRLWSHDAFAAVFDRLMTIPGMRAGLKLSTVHKILGMRCDEENLNCLKYILEIWEGLVGGAEALNRIDRETVVVMQGKAPGVSSIDAQMIRGKLLSGEIFAHFSDEERTVIWERAAQLKTMVYTVEVFFDNLDYLERLAQSMKLLVKVESDETLRRALLQSYTDCNQTAGQVLLQQNEHSFQQSLGAIDECKRYGIDQLWIAAMRYHRDLLGESDPDKHTTRNMSTAVNPEMRHRFGSLAMKLGFESPEIADLKTEDPERRIALKALLQARNEGSFAYDEAQIEQHISAMKMMFSTARPKTSEEATPLLVRRRGTKVKRSGFSLINDHENDRSHLFLPQLSKLSQSQDEEITSYFVHQSFFFAYIDPQLLRSELSNGDHDWGADTMSIESVAQGGDPDPLAQDDDGMIHEGDGATTAASNELSLWRPPEAGSPLPSTSRPSESLIRFMTQERGQWIVSNTVAVDDFDQVQRVAKKYIRKDFLLFDDGGQSVAAGDAYKAARANSNVLRVKQKDSTIQQSSIGERKRIAYRSEDEESEL